MSLFKKLLKKLKSNRCMYCGKDSGEFGSCHSCERKVISQVRDGGGYDPYILASENAEMVEARKVLHVVK